MTTVAGTGEPGYSRGGGPGTLAQIREPNDCFLDGNVGLLIADIQDHRIRRLNLDTEIMTTSAGDGEKLREGDDKPLNFLMGQVMKSTQGKANPGEVRKRLVELIRGAG